MVEGAGLKNLSGEVGIAGSNPAIRTMHTFKKIAIAFLALSFITAQHWNQPANLLYGSTVSLLYILLYLNEKKQITTLWTEPRKSVNTSTTSCQGR